MALLPSGTCGRPGSLFRLIMPFLCQWLLIQDMCLNRDYPPLCFFQLKKSTWKTFCFPLLQLILDWPGPPSPALVCANGRMGQFNRLSMKGGRILPLPLGDADRMKGQRSPPSCECLIALARSREREAAPPAATRGRRAYGGPQDPLPAAVVLHRRPCWLHRRRAYHISTIKVVSDHR